MAPLQVVYEDFSACCDEFVEGVSYLRELWSVPCTVRGCHWP